MTPVVSLVVAARNAASTLSETLRSLQAQTYTDWEALIVDDQSSDATPDVISTHATKDARFIPLRGAGVGVSAARNLGIAAARGRWLAFLDADDWHDPSFLSVMLAALDANPHAAVASCWFRRAMPSGRHGPDEGHLPEEFDAFEVIARSCTVAIHTVVVARTLVIEVGGFDPSLNTCEDWDLWARVARTGVPWLRVNQALSFYRVTPGSLSRQAERCLADARTVLGRTFAPDPRVPPSSSTRPVPSARFGSRAHSEAAMALWYGAYAAARGGDVRPFAASLAGFRNCFEEWMPRGLLTAVCVGLQVVPAETAARWREFGPGVTRLIQHAGRLVGDTAGARRLQYAFEQLLLDYDDLTDPRELELTLGLRVNLRHPTPCEPPPGVDRIYAYFCYDDQIIGVARFGVLGSLGRADWWRIARLTIGWQPRHLPEQLAVGVTHALRAVELVSRRPAALLRAGAVRTLWRDAVAQPPRGERGQRHSAQLARARKRAETAMARVQNASQPAAPREHRARARTADAQSRSSGLISEIPILMYHRVADMGPEALARYRVTLEAFRAQMSWLSQHGYHALGSAELALHLEQRLPFRRQPVLISFDDGYLDFAENAWPILREHELTAEVFIVTGKVGRTADWDAPAELAAPLMDAVTISQLSAEGVRFGSHLATHRVASGLATRALAHELLQSRAVLSGWLGSEIRSLAAPYGVSDERLRKLAEECGYSTLLTTEDGVANLESNAFHLPRIEVRGDMPIEEFVRRVRASSVVPERERPPE